MVENFNEVERKKACPELDSGNDQNEEVISLRFLIKIEANNTIALQFNGASKY